MAKLSKKKEDNIPILESKFTLLKELVKAPLLAVAESNTDLAKSIMNYIHSSGQMISTHDEKVMFLENINLGYQQVKQGSNNVQLIEDMALQVPLLSIMPISNLQIKKAKIDFNAEVRGVEDEEHQILYEARVCAPESRVTDYLSKIHFEIEVESSEVTEGLARFVDVLNMHQIPKKLETRPIDKTGNVLHGENHKNYEIIQKLNDELKNILLTCEKLEVLIHEQKLTFDSLIKNVPDLSESNYDLFALNKTDQQIRKQPKSKILSAQSELLSLFDNIQTNLDNLSKLVQRKQDIQNELLQTESQKVLQNEKG